MAETVEHMPEGGSSAIEGQKYQWEQWLDGQVWKLTETVTLEAVLDEVSGEVVVPEQVVEGDFSVDVEKLRSYARNAGKRRANPRTVRTKTQTEVIEVVRVAGEPPVAVKRRVLYVQGTDVSPTGGRPGRPTAQQAVAAVAADDPGEDGEQLTLPVVDDAAVAQVQAELDQLVGDEQPVRQSDIEQPVEEGDPEWAEIPATEDPQDPYSPAVVEPWPATDPADEVELEAELATDRPVS